MTDVAAVLSAIDGALDDYELSPDAMRWEPPWDESSDPIVRDPIDRFEILASRGYDGYAAQALVRKPFARPGSRVTEYVIYGYSRGRRQAISVPVEMNLTTGSRRGDAVEILVSFRVLWDEFRRRVLATGEALSKLAAWLNDPSIDEAETRRLSAMHTEYHRRSRARRRRRR